MAARTFLCVLRPVVFNANLGTLLKAYQPQMLSVRATKMIHPTQYDVPFPAKMRFTNVISNNWEVLPLFGITALAMGGMVFSIYWACLHKIDVVFNRTHDPEYSLARSGNLLNPPIHKLYVVNRNSIAKPWPEMHIIRDKMRVAETKLELKRKAREAALKKRAQAKAQRAERKVGVKK